MRSLRQSSGIAPTLVILNSNPGNLASAKYADLKVARGEELGIEVVDINIEEDRLAGVIKDLNADETVHGIILQLPLEDRSKEDEMLALIAPGKDVDGLGDEAEVLPATAKAIEWLLAGFGIDLKGKDVIIIGKGRLVGGPLAKLWCEQGLNVRTYDVRDPKLEILEAVGKADVVVSAAGVPGLIKTENLRDGQVVVDAGTAGSGGELMGDIDPEVYESDLDIKISARKGGVGPLTISCLFENILELIDKHKAKVL